MAGAPRGGKLSARAVNSFRNTVLGWYDRNRRVLPWRPPPGRRADPYHVWLSEVMLQQTVVAAVIPYFLKFVERWPRVTDLAAAPVEDVMQAWAGLGYYSRARNLHACARAVAEAGAFPREQEALRRLPGIGEYTSGAIAAIAFDHPAVVVDGNVERVLARYFAVTEPFPAGKKQVKAWAGLLAEGRADRPGDYTQALMDLGATICIPKAPRCGSCPLHRSCRGQAAGLAAQLPRKALKAARPQKIGNVYWIEDTKGRVLLERRPEKGLFGGMAGFPVSIFVDQGGNLKHPAGFERPRKLENRKILHSFTHFDLTLQGHRAGLISDTIPGDNRFWVHREALLEAGLPSLFRKFALLMLK